MSGKRVFDLVIRDIESRNQLGWAQHNKHLLSGDRDLRGWLIEAYEECLDMAVYLRGAMASLDDDRLETLLSRARTVHMTPEEKEQQRRGFAYGNVHIENQNVTREMVDEAAEKLATLDLTTRPESLDK